jgi:hypothetical protein
MRVLQPCPSRCLQALVVDNINGPHLLREMNEPQRSVILVADWNVYQLALVLSDTNEKMASKFVRSRATFQEMHLRKDGSGRSLKNGVIGTVESDNRSNDMRYLHRGTVRQFSIRSD